MCKNWSLGEFVCTLNIRRKLRIRNTDVQKNIFQWLHGLYWNFKLFESKSAIYHLKILLL
jgi:hypothetical protein